MLHSEFSFLLHEFASAFSNEIPEFYYLFVENVRFPLEESPFFFFFIFTFHADYYNIILLKSITGTS